MTFQNFPCWQIDRVRNVMNATAELASRDIFLAVHSEYPLPAVNPAARDAIKSPQWALNPHAFLQEFLSSDRHHVQVAVDGDSGSGKSHLIRWIELNIPDDPGRYLISIPRSGISLRGIIECILTVLPEQEAQPYRDRLNQAGDEQSTPKHLEERLLSEIALAIDMDEPLTDDNPDLETELIKGLPNLFHDPYLRSHFRRTGGIVGQLANQVLSGSSEYVPAEERREFSIADLPLTGIQTVKMSRAACDIADFLRLDRDSQLMAVEIINRNLNRAIGQVLNFTGDRLIRLLNEVRRHLRMQGKELVLLIEDLARCQGLDLALLDALIDEGNDDNGLCTLRWAVAMTTGYYERMKDTVKTRMNFVLHMDLPTSGEHRLVNEFSIVAFAARYLNAVRLNPEELNIWAARPNKDRGNPPVACETCKYRTPCHNAFGAVDSIGLYPFNKYALINMLRRLDSRLDERFNPRVLVKDVLAEVLGTYGRDLANDQFPSGQLLSQMGGPKLPPVVSDALRRQNPEQAERQLVVLELWGSGTTVTDLPVDLYSAFGLTKPITQGASHPPETPEAPEEQSTEVVTDRRLAAIRAWGNGSTMQDDLLNYIRPRVFDSIVSHIDWDREGLVRSIFTGGGAPFRIETISFRRQLTQPRFPPVRLEIPLRDEVEALTEAAMALEGIYQFIQHGNWNIANGPRLLDAVANCLDEWSTHVIAQLKLFPVAPESWDTGASAVEVLSVGSAMGGRLSDASAPISDMLNALFEEWPEESPEQSPEWRTLYRMLRKDQIKLRDIALARASGTKGGQRATFVDPSKLITPLQHVRQQWELTHHPPEGTVNRRDDYGLLARLHARIATNLRTIAEAEWHRKTVWVNNWRQDIPEGIDCQEVVKAFRELLALVIEHGIGFRRQAGEAIESVLTDLETVYIDDAIRSATILLEAKNPIGELAELGRDPDDNTIATVRKFLPAARDFLDEIESSLQPRLDRLSDGERALQKHKVQIGNALQQLSHDIEVIGGSDGYNS